MPDLARRGLDRCSREAGSAAEVPPRLLQPQLFTAVLLEPRGFDLDLGQQGGRAVGSVAQAQGLEFKRQPGESAGTDTRCNPLQAVGMTEQLLDVSLLQGGPHGSDPLGQARQELMADVIEERPV